jgi:hypothetical protein
MKSQAQAARSNPRKHQHAADSNQTPRNETAADAEKRLGRHLCRRGHDNGGETWPLCQVSLFNQTLTEA